MKNNEDRKNRKKTEEKLHISISNIEIGFLNFVRFILFTILVTFSVLEKLRNSIFEIPMIPQSLSTCKSLESLSNILLKTFFVKTVFTLIVFEILLFEGRSVLGPAQRFLRRQRVKY